MPYATAAVQRITLNAAAGDYLECLPDDAALTGV